jgi:hypothetical protein
MNTQMRLVIARAEPVEAQVSVEDVRRDFYSQWAVGNRYYWWIREMFLDPEELIVCDENDEIYRMGYTISEDGVAFDDPRQVKIQFVDAAGVPKGDMVAAAVAGIRTVRGSKVAASFSTRAESRPDEQEGGSVDLSKLRKSLGLSADTPDEEVIRLAAERVAASPEEETPAGEPEGEEAPEGTEGQEGSSGQEATAASGTVTVDKATFEQLKAGATMGVQARTQQIVEERNHILDAAIASGKFPRGRREHWASLLEKDPEGTKATIASLAEGLIPVKDQEIGAGSGEGTEGPAYPAGWLPDVAARKAQLAAGLRGRVAMESVK